MSDYERLAARVVLGGIVTDPWLDGVPRLSETPVFLDGSLAARLARAAEDLAYAYHEACLLVAARPSLLDDFYGLSPAQKVMWLASAPRWHGIARADVFVTSEGLAVTELNSDTPTGEAEAVVLGDIFAEAHPDARDPNAGLGARFVAMVEALAQGPLATGVPRTAAIVYPTELTEDLALVRQYKRWLEAAGWTVVLGSPFNLAAGPDGEACLWGEPCAVVVRHYKTDWWSERVAAWDDVDLADRVPLARELTILLEAELAGKTTVVNPFGAVVPQNKRTMALFWEHLADLPERAQSIVRALVPPTFRLESRTESELIDDRAGWVLKSDYGSEGDEVVVGAAVTDALWRESLAHARPGRWVVQRFFEAQLDDAGREINHGVFVIAGQAAGHYVRVQRGPTDDRAVSAAVLVRPLFREMAARDAHVERVHALFRELVAQGIVAARGRPSLLRFADGAVLGVHARPERPHRLELVVRPRERLGVHENVERDARERRSDGHQPIRQQVVRLHAEHRRRPKMKVVNARDVARAGQQRSAVATPIERHRLDAVAQRHHAAQPHAVLEHRRRALGRRQRLERRVNAGEMQRLLEVLDAELPVGRDVVLAAIRAREQRQRHPREVRRNGRDPPIERRSIGVERHEHEPTPRREPHLDEGDRRPLAQQSAPEIVGEPVIRANEGITPAGRGRDQRHAAVPAHVAERAQHEIRSAYDDEVFSGRGRAHPCAG